MIDQRTANLSLPLPHPSNDLSEDVERLIAALVAIDQKISALDLLLNSDDLTLDTMQELVTAIKAARTEMGAVSAQLEAQDAAITAQLDAQNAMVADELTAISALSALVYAAL